MKVFFVLVVGFAAGVSFGQMTIEPIAVNGWRISQAHDVNSDGTVVIGAMYPLVPAGCHLFRWTAATGPTDLGVGNGISVNSDGSAISGINGVGPFKWTPTSGIVSLSQLPGYNASQATKISGNGHIVAGFACSSIDINKPELPFRYTTATGPVAIPLPPNSTEAWVDDMTFTGQTTLIHSMNESYTWTSTAGYQQKTLPFLMTNFQMKAISSDGSAIVGGATMPFTGHQAARWLNGATSIIANFSENSEATDTAKEGIAVVGWYNNRAGAFVWNATAGARSLLSYLQTNNVAGASQWTSLSEFAPQISEDGRTIIGTGIYNDRETGFRIFRAGGWQNMP